MAALPFTLLEFWLPTLTIIFLFFAVFLRSFSTFSEALVANGHNKKTKLKYLQQQATKSPDISALLWATLGLNLVTHASSNQLGITATTKIGLFPFLCIFTAFYSVMCFFQLRLTPTPQSHSRMGVGSTGIFLSLFAPLAYLTATATNFLEFVLPFELISYIFYLVFLEFTGISGRSVKNRTAQTKSLMRGLLYYFWFSFLGTVLLFLAVYFISVTALSFDFHDLQSAFSGTNRISVLCGSLLLSGIGFKMGGIFFFFFKADLYKLLDIVGTLVFSVYTTFFYILIFFCLTAKLPFMWWILKYVAGGLIAVSTVLFALVVGFRLYNVYLFIGLSSVLTVLFCLLVLI